MNIETKKLPMNGKFFIFGSRFNISHCKNKLISSLSSVKTDGWNMEHFERKVYLSYGKQQYVDESVAKCQHYFEGWIRMRKFWIQFSSQNIDVY